MFDSLILFNYSILECPLCHTILKRYNMYNDEVHEAPQEANLETAEFRNDLKKVKKIIVEKNKSMRAFRSVVHTNYNNFKEATAPIRENLKEIRKQTLETLKNSDEYKNVKSFTNKCTHAVSSLANRYNLTFRSMRDLGLTFSQRYNRPSTILRRKFG